MKLGRRIVIIGPSNSGKSTLADTIGKTLSHAVLHLDQIAHRPGTNWERVPDEEMKEAQQRFLKTHESWVIEGNYSHCMVERLDAADMVIWCDPSLMGCIWRYILRCWRKDVGRPGNLEGAKGEFNWELIRYTWVNYPQNKKKYQAFLQLYPHLPVMALRSFMEIKRLGREITSR